MPEATADQINDAAMCDNKWQFKITGGIDFGMPITIFQVTEGGRADKAGIKLGDSIVQLQNQDTTEMPLKEAQQIIDKAGDQLQMTVQKFEDEENDKNEEVEIILKADKEKKKAPTQPAKDQPNLPDSIDDQLKSMQKRLSEIAMIPLQIQNTLLSVTKMMERFIPASLEFNQSMDKDSEIDDEDYPDLETNLVFHDLPDEDEENNDLLSNSENETEEHYEKDSLISDQVSELDDHNIEITQDEHQIDDIEEELPKADTPPPTPEPEKKNVFEKKWPWSDQEKVSFKKSNFQSMRSNSLIKNRIQQLNQKELMAAYSRDQNFVGN